MQLLGLSEMTKLKTCRSPKLAYGLRQFGACEPCSARHGHL